MFISFYFIVSCHVSSLCHRPKALIGISLFDAFSSLMYMLGTVMTPKESGLYQAVGNNFTCKLQVSEFGFMFLLHAHPRGQYWLILINTCVNISQGFFLQLGTTSALFNACLSIYFYLVVCKNWRERYEL